MKHSIKTGLCFGLTSGTITTLGLMVGLHSGTHSKLAVIGGIITIAIADAFSDALGIHTSEESKNNKTKYIWESTVSTFLTKFLYTLTFILPILFVKDLSEAMIINIVWGLIVLTFLNFYIAKDKKEKPWKVITEHVAIALIVIIISHLVGDFVRPIFF